MRRALVKAGRSRCAGNPSISSAATPAAEGADMLVPLKLWYRPRLPPPTAEWMSTPVATTWGINRPSAVGP